MAVSIKKRKINYKHSDRPLTSKRDNIILSNAKDSKNLVAAIRDYRQEGKGTFTVSKETAEKLKEKVD